MVEKLYNFRFEIFFLSLLSILFGGIFFPDFFFKTVLTPILFLINIAAGVILISKNKGLMRFFMLLLALVLLIYFHFLFVKYENENYEFIRLAIYFIFYLIVTYELIKQVWQATFVSKNVIIGVMCGYFCLGLLGFFIFVAVEMLHPGSFNGIVNSKDAIDEESLLYYSYVTLLSIGYGEITPITVFARKASLLTGFLGQFYMVILTAVIVGKYINQAEKKKRLD